jgi:hypothetical protein
MPNRVQTLRSSAPGNLPQAGTRAPGELWVNFADSNFGYIDASQTAQKLLAVRLFVTTTSYATGDFVVYAGDLYRATAPSAQGVFTAANWTKIGTMQDFATYLPLSGGTLTGPLTLAGSPANANQAANRSYVDAGDATVLAAANTKLPLAGGTLTGTLTLAGPPTQPLQAATKAYVDSGSFLPISGGALTGGLSVSGNLDVTGAVVGGTWQWASDGGFSLSGSGVDRYLSWGGGGYYIHWSASSGALQFVGNSAQIGYWDYAGNLTVAGALSIGGGFNAPSATITNIAANNSINCPIFYNNPTFTGGITVNGGGTISGVSLSGGGISAPSGVNTGSAQITAGNVMPFANNGASCGQPGYAWFQVCSYNFPNASDPRDKKNITDAPPGALGRVNSVPVHKYHWAEEDDADPLHTGWLAPEVDAALSQHAEAVVLTAEDERQSLLLSLNEMVAVLWQAVQELSDKVVVVEQAVISR